MSHASDWSIRECQPADAAAIRVRERRLTCGIGGDDGRQARVGAGEDVEGHGAPGDRKDIDAFINHVLSPEAQAQMSKLGRTRPVNEHAEVSEAIAASCPLASDLNKVDIGYLNENRSQIIDQWNQSVNN